MRWQLETPASAACRERELTGSMSFYRKRSKMESHLREGGVVGKHERVCGG
jgi:hypothetical protein